MSYNTQSKDETNPNEARMRRATLTRDLISLKEARQKEKAKIDKIDLDGRYLARDKNQLWDDTESKRGRLRVIENDMSQMEKNLEEKKKMRKMVLIELDKMQVEYAEIEGKIKSKNHEKEQWQDEIRDLDREIKNLEVEIREV